MSEKLPPIQCSVGGCEEEIPSTTEAMQLLLLQTHIKDAHGAMQAPLGERREAETGAKAQKLQRPVIPEDCTEIQWAFFIDKWEDYKGFYKLTGREEIYSHLRSCCDDTLQYKL